jgi:hypothetical protein
MPHKKRRSPAEKKALSYAKDRRNNYGENDKASRKAIPRNKAKGHRANRRRAARTLDRFEMLDLDEAALAENAITSDLDRLKRWKKSPDQPLGDHIKRQDGLRKFRAGRKAWVQRNMEDAKIDGASGFRWSWGGSDVASWFDSH